MNSASILIDQLEQVGRNTNSTSLAAARPRTSGWRRGEKLSAMMWRFCPGHLGAQDLEEFEELAVSFAAPDAVVDLPGGQVERGEHVHDAVPAVVGGLDRSDEPVGRHALPLLGAGG
ncbi:hypothetical protein [Saccharothrix luteola]|uniref:hypothetical protein n=1 Tax=Saccharothrix luteola TaxID=2893018 RepID=UPI001E57C00E|nr:hypothetical protein [Saccharothrix luteola]MCC8245484.1 hypothetical protein [Saccharothrix luteola]